MAGTLIRVFDKIADAQGARNELLNAGFEADRIQLSSQEDEAGTLEGDFKLPSEDTGEPARHSGKGLRGLIDSIMGNKETEEKSVNSDAVSRGSFVMTVEAEDESRLAQASDIVDRFHALDIERRTPG